MVFYVGNIISLGSTTKKHYSGEVEAEAGSRASGHPMGPCSYIMSYGVKLGPVRGCIEGLGEIFMEDAINLVQGSYSICLVPKRVPI